MINSYDLKYFITLAESKNLTFAAKVLNISQPALSHSLKRMETEIGMALFERSTKGMFQLTRAGQRLYEKGANLNRDIQSLPEIVKADDLQLAGRFIIGCHPSVGIYSLPNFILKLQKAFPAIELELDHGLSREISNRVTTGKIDLGIIINPTPFAHLIIRKLGEDEVTLWCSKTITDNKKTLIYNPELNQSQVILKQLAKKKIFFENKLESSNLELISELVHSGCGVGILPHRVIQSHKANTIQKFSPDSPVYKDSICLVYREGLQKTQTGKALIDCFKDSFQS